MPNSWERVPAKVGGGTIEGLTGGRKPGELRGTEVTARLSRSFECYCEDNRIKIKECQPDSATGPPGTSPQVCF